MCGSWTMMQRKRRRSNGLAAMLQSSIRQLHDRYGARLNIHLMSVCPSEDRKQIPWDFIIIVPCKPEQLLFVAFPLALFYKLFSGYPPVKKRFAGENHKLHNGRK